MQWKGTGLVIFHLDRLLKKQWRDSVTAGSFGLSMEPPLLLFPLLLAGGVLGVLGSTCPSNLSLGGTLYQATGDGGLLDQLCLQEGGRGGGRGCLYRKKGGVEGVSYCIPYSPAPSSSCCASQVPTTSLIPNMSSLGWFPAPALQHPHQPAPSRQSASVV